MSFPHHSIFHRRIYSCRMKCVVHSSFLFLTTKKKNYCTVFLLFSLRVWHKKVLFLPSFLTHMYVYIPALAMYKSTGLRYKKKRHWSVSTFVMLAQNVIHAWYFVYREKNMACIFIYRATFAFFSVFVWTLSAMSSE